MVAGEKSLQGSDVNSKGLAACEGFGPSAGTLLGFWFSPHSARAGKLDVKWREQWNPKSWLRHEQPQTLNQF